MSHSRHAACGSSTKKSKKRAAKNADVVREKLVMTGQMEVLYDIVDDKLSECGWKGAVHDILREEILKKGRNLTLEQLHDLVKDEGRKLVPPAVRRQLTNEIMKSYEMPAPAMDERRTNGHNGHF